MSRKQVTRYYAPDEERSFTPSEFKRLAMPRQIEIMRHWFHAEFSDPNILPYDSGEGGYQWIWGGPYNARQELAAEFGEIAKEAAIAELESELSDQSTEWSRNPDTFPPDDEFLPDLDLSLFSPFDVLMISLLQIEETARFKNSGIDVPFLHRLLFANVLTAMETYLGDTFIKALREDDERLDRFLKTTPGLKDQKVLIGDVLGLAKDIWRPVSQRLNKVIWHNLRDAAVMYHLTLKVDFPDDLTVITTAIKDRHDIVHRNGKSLDGVIGKWEPIQITNLTRAVRLFAETIESSCATRDTRR